MVEIIHCASEHEAILRAHAILMAPAQDAAVVVIDRHGAILFVRRAKNR